MGHSLSNNLFLRFLVFAWSVSASGAHAADVQFRDIEIPDQSGKVMTVLGPAKPAALGTTLMHEHLFIEYLQFLSLEKPDKWKETSISFPATKENSALFPEMIETSIPFPETKEAQRHWNAPFTTRDRRIYP